MLHLVVVNRDHLFDGLFNSYVGWEGVITRRFKGEQLKLVRPITITHHSNVSGLNNLRYLLALKGVINTISLVAVHVRQDVLYNLKQSHLSH
ncbi:hypothetical protein D3C78_876920 [compost metagenome]